MTLLTELVQHMPGAQLGGAGAARRLIFEVDGVWLDARARESPVLEIFIRTARLPFKARIRPGYVVETDDDFYSTLWLDAACENALTGIGGFDVYIQDGEVLLTRGGDVDPIDLALAVRAAGVVAARPHRIAADWLEAAHTLGGTTTSDRWDCDGGFEAVVERGAATVRLDNYLGDQGLRTRVRARRVAPDGDRWALWKPKVPRGYRPRVEAEQSLEWGNWHGVAADSSRLIDRLRPLDPMLVAADPDVMWTDGDEVTLWWSGLYTLGDVLGPATELVARLAVEINAAESGPYR